MRVGQLFLFQVGAGTALSVVLTGVAMGQSMYDYPGSPQTYQQPHANQQQVQWQPQLSPPPGPGGEVMASQNPADMYFTPAQDQPAMNKLISDLMAFRGRLERVERAMIRLDRRMQLVERREMERMGGAMPSLDQQSTLSPQRSYADTVPTQQVNPYRGNFKPVAYQAAPSTVPQPVTSSLQPAAPLHTQQQLARLNTQASALPSLADETPRQKAGADIAIWTINYEEDKIWPGRDQLAASREVVSALRSDEPVALFARGASPNSKEFRERVKAISKYLGKVADVEQVAIAALESSNLDDQTLEIFVTK